MNSVAKDNTNYLLTANVAEFDLEGAITAKNELSDALDDLTFQLGLPPSEFQGDNYASWLKKATYKKNRMASTYRKFKARVIELQRETALDTLADKILNFLDGLSAEYRSTALAEDLYQAASRIPRYIK